MAFAKCDTVVDSEGSLCTFARGPSSLVRGWDNETVGQEEGGRMGRFDGGRLGGWEDRRRGRARREAGGKKDGVRKKTKPYTTIPSRGVAPGKLPLDRPHQGAVMLAPCYFQIDICRYEPYGP